MYIYIPCFISPYCYLNLHPIIGHLNCFQFFTLTKGPVHISITSLIIFYSRVLTGCWDTAQIGVYAQLTLVPSEALSVLTFSVLVPNHSDPRIDHLDPSCPCHQHQKERRLGNWTKAKTSGVILGRGLM